ncbi:hypothetical protein FB451DRAFT_1052311 [Mycena latifolia]|nr:hypothetical protein FB451DRAFT_1052311 [Mycena latifolia]
MRGLPLDDPAPKRSPKTALERVLLALVLLAAVGVFLTPQSTDGVRTAARDFQALPVACPAQVSPLAPPIAFSIPTSLEGKAAYAERLRGAVRVPTETFDGAPDVGDDVWYDKFYAFEAYLTETFPDVFGTLKLEHFATHGLLLTWAGSDETLAPIILMAHQDTVPVPAETVARWTHPPFDAHLDEDGWVWGRGAGDCKNLLIAHLSAVSELLAAGFAPTRTILISFGFDEEGSSSNARLQHSARYIAAHIEEVYGLDSIFMIVDEGGGIMADHFGQTWVAPATGEKGSVNIKVAVNVPGGHSSIPPAHTAIGALSALVTEIEAHPPPFALTAANPFATFAVCLGKYGTIDSELKRLLAHERTWPAAAALMAERDPGDGARLSTTQAVDIVSGGVKVNALPEQAYVIVNHRVSVDDSILEYVYPRHFSVFMLNLIVYAGFGDDPPASATRYLQLSSPNGAEASPVTPTKGAAWECVPSLNSSLCLSQHLWLGAIVAPYLSTGGTDTRSFVNLTSAIFRFQGVRDSERVNIHTVDERVHVDGHLNAIAWVHAFIQNADAFRE